MYSPQAYSDYGTARYNAGVEDDRARTWTVDITFNQSMFCIPSSMVESVTLLTASNYCYIAGSDNMTTDPSNIASRYNMIQNIEYSKNSGTTFANIWSHPYLAFGYPAGGTKQLRIKMKNH